MTNSDTISDTVLEQIQKAFIDFQKQSEKLSKAYTAMQEDFKKVNIELDKKNRELEESFFKQEEVQTCLNSILESMSSGVVSVDNDGIVTQFNRAAFEITGYKPEEVIERKFADVFSDTALSNKNVLAVLKSGKGNSRDEKVIWHKSGTPVAVGFQSALLKDRNNRRLGAVEIFSDISRIKSLEKEMRQSKTMAALGEMAATVAHEIRNPLGAMGVWAGLLDRDFEPGDQRRQILTKIIDALSQLNRIVSNLLVYSRPLNVQFRKVALQDVLHETVNFIEIESESEAKKIDIHREWEAATPLLYVHGDPEKLQQMVMNLCLNAVQAMPEGGTLSVACCRAGKESKGFISFSIADTGVGISKENLNKIFDPFFTTKENGTGLGLAIVKKFVDYHSGYINVKSTVNEGTTVQVFLPEFQEKG
jgi:PAS domain S-box-containing protein